MLEEDYPVPFEDLEKIVPNVLIAIESGMNLGVEAKGSKVLSWDLKKNSYVVLDRLDLRGEHPTLVPDQIPWENITVFAHAIPHIQRVVSKVLQQK